MKNQSFFILLLLFLINFFIASLQPATGEDSLFEGTINVDGRTYKIAPGFTIPSNIDTDSPVKMIFSEETHELLAIERMIDDDSDSSELEYHFGIVNAITRAKTDLEYRVYVDGVGYLFTGQTRIDEEIAFLDKFASVALVTQYGRVLICKVLASNTAVPVDDIFYGAVEQAVREDDWYIITVSGAKHILGPETETVGTVMAAGTWVFGYEISETVKFISVIQDSFPDPADVVPFSGFVSFAGEPRKDGSLYFTVDGTTLRILPDSALKGNIIPGNFISGYRLGNIVLMASSGMPVFDNSRIEIFYQPADDLVSVRNINSPSGETTVAILFGKKEAEVNSYTKVIGELKKGLPVMAVALDGKTVLAAVRSNMEQGRVPVSGFISSVSGSAPDYEISIGGDTYHTSFATIMAAENSPAAGMTAAGIAAPDGTLELLACFEGALPYTNTDKYSGIISKIGINAFQIDDRIIDYDSATSISGSFREGKHALVLKDADHAEMIYILPDSYSDLDYHTVSGVLSGIGTPDTNGKRFVRLDDEVFYLDKETVINRNPGYDEVGIALYKGAGQVSVIDVLPKPDDKGHKFQGKITEVLTDPVSETIFVTIGNSRYTIPAIAAFSGFSSPSRIISGAIAEGYAYGSEILVLRILRGSGLFGVLDPPWMEYVLSGTAVMVILIFLVVKTAGNLSSWHTGRPETGAGNTIILHEENGQTNRYTVDESMFGFIIGIHEKTVTVKVRKGKIIEVR